MGEAFQAQPFFPWILFVSARLFMFDDKVYKIERIRHKILLGLVLNTYSQIREQELMMLLQVFPQKLAIKQELPHRTFCVLILSDLLPSIPRLE